MTSDSCPDVLIVGAGHVGLSAALALAQAGLHVYLIDERLYRPRQELTDYDCRVSAVTPASTAIFQRLGIWDAIAALRISPFKQIDVWQEGSDRGLHFDAADVHRSELGFIIENSIMQEVLFAKVMQTENITYHAPASLKNLMLEDAGIRTEFADGSTCFAKLLIGADGAHSSVRRLANIQFSEKSYSQHALVATIQTQRPHRQIARQRFLHSGPLAFLPLADQHLCSIVWSHDSAIAKNLQALPDVEFNTALQDAFGSDLGEVRVASQRQIFPLHQRHVKNYVLPRIALIGDAAHSLHPLAGQGLNLGLQDALSLADILLAAKSQQRDIGLLHTLKRYERNRKTTNAIMLSVIDGFHYFFRQKMFPVTTLRKVGLQLTNKMKLLKKIIMQQAMGLS